MIAGRAYLPLKRAMDVAVAGVGLVAAAPVMGVTAAAVAARLGLPVLFTQRRPGRNGEVFTLYKFRTMRNASPAEGLVSDADRMTPLGGFLRATSLDELPSLWNVLRGDMSFVGPRPLLEAYLPLYTPAQARRHEVRPGITGLAQVSGRNAVSWEDRFALDVRYVDDLSLANDLRILLRTVRSVLVREGISAEGHATVAPFLGSTVRDQEARS